MNVDGTIAIKDNEDFLEGLDNPAALHGAWDRLEGQDRFYARKVIVEIFEEAGLLDKIEPHKHMVPHGDRGGVPIEPRLTEQWFVDNKTLGQPALESVREGRTRFIPRNWENTYFNWLENIERGAFPASSGGDTRFPHGMVPTVRSSSKRPRKRRYRRRSSTTSLTKGR